jgi:hypothetical protein
MGNWEWGIGYLLFVICYWLFVICYLLAILSKSDIILIHNS